MGELVIYALVFGRPGKVDMAMAKRSGALSQGRRSGTVFSLFGTGGYCDQYF